jgi:hypothetical protein
MRRAVASGSWGGQRPSRGDYVMVTRATDGATAAAGGANVAFAHLKSRIARLAHVRIRGSSDGPLPGAIRLFIQWT